MEICVVERHSNNSQNKFPKQTTHNNFPLNPNFIPYFRKAAQEIED